MPLFSVDLRALALFRILAAATILTDLALRSRDLVAMYTDTGVFARELSAHWYRWSIHAVNGSAGFQIALFLLAGVAGVMLLIGYQTRLATIVSWVLLTSLHHHAPLIINAGDSFLRMMLFWGMFLPLSAVWSIDARRRAPAGRPENPYRSVATIAAIMQVLLVYLFTGLYKIKAPGWLEGEGIYNALAWGLYTRPLGRMLLENPDVMQWLSWGTLVLEIAGPALVVIFWRSSRVRLLLIAAFILLHIGIELTLHVGLFSYVSLIAWTVLLPTAFFEHGPLPVLDRLLSGGGAADAEGNGSKARDAGWRKWTRLAANCLCGLALIFAVFWNVAAYRDRFVETTIPVPLRQAAEAGMLRQSWAMFARPAMTHAWFVGDARLANGRRIDILRDGQPPTDAAPDPLRAQLPNHRWRKLFANLSDPRFRHYSQDVVEFMAADWNASHAEKEQIVVLEVRLNTRRLDPEASADNYQSDVIGRVEYGKHIEDTLNFDLPY